GLLEGGRPLGRLDGGVPGVAVDRLMGRQRPLRRGEIVEYESADLLPLLLADPVIGVQLGRFEDLSPAWTRPPDVRDGPAAGDGEQPQLAAGGPNPQEAEHLNRILAGLPLVARDVDGADAPEVSVEDLEQAGSVVGTPGGPGEHRPQSMLLGRGQVGDVKTV